MTNIILPRKWNRAVRYAVAPVAVALALGCRLALNPILEDASLFVFFIVPIIVSGWLGGLGPGMLAMILSMLAIDYFFLPPIGSIGLTGPKEIVQTVSFLILGTLVSLIIARMRREQRRVEKAAGVARASESETRRAEAALREGEQRLRFALEICHIGAWDLDLVDHTASRSLEHDRIFGYSKLLPQWTYEMFMEHVLPEDRERVDSDFLRAMENQSGWSFECRIRRADGEVRWIWAAGRHRTDGTGGMRRMAGIVEDITERKEAETALRESEQRLSLAQQAARIGSFDWNIQTNVNTWTRELEAMYGLKPGEFGKTETAWEQLVHPEDRQAAIGLVNRAFETGQPSEGEWRVQWREGSVHWIYGRFQVLRNEAGKPLRLTGVNIDITERKQAEERLREAERLRESERRLADIINFLPDATFALDNIGRIIAWNKAMEELTGAPAGDVLGKGNHEYTYRLYGERIPCLADELLRGDQPGWSFSNVVLDHDIIKAETCIPRLKPGGVWLAIKVAPIYDAQGNVVGVIDSCRDITQRKRAEANQELLTDVLKNLNRGGNLHALIADTLRLIREASGFDAVGLRLRQGEDCPYFEQNGFSEAFLREENFLCARCGKGAIIRDAEGKAVLECTCGLVLSGQIDSSLPCFTGGGSFWTNSSLELLALPPEADPRTNPRNRCIHVGYESVGLFPVRAGAEVIGLLQLNDQRGGRFTPELIAFYETMAQNIGMALQRAGAEEALRDADRRKDEFLAMLAHELRNPLAPIRYAVQMLNMKELGQEQIQKQHEVIDRQVSHMGRLLDDLLEVSRITRGKIELRREVVDLRTVATQALDSLRPMIEGRGQHLLYEAPSSPLPVNGDPTRLEQIIRNLLHNAHKYTEAGGCIKLRLMLETDHEHEWRVAVRVSDSGIGIAPEMLLRVFDLFSQAEQSLARTQGGLGIGLAMVKSLAQMHGGSVEAYSAGSGCGSEFVVRLPLADEVLGGLKGVSAPAETSRAAPSKPRRVLVVDDNEDSAASLGELLSLWGHEVQTAHDGRHALAQARRWQPEIILLDIGLPGMDGYEVARRLRETPATSSAFLVALTGYGQDEDRRRAREAGFNRHLTKPVELEKLQKLFHETQMV